MNPIQTVYLKLMQEHRPKELKELQDNGKLTEELDAVAKRLKRLAQKMADEAFKRTRSQGPVVVVQETEVARREAEEIVIQELMEEIGSGAEADTE